MEQVACNLCGSTGVVPLFILPDLLLARKDVLATFVKCVQCGLIYQNPRPMQEEMAGHYPPEYELYAAEPDGDNASWLLKRAIQYGMAKRVRFVTRYKRAGRLLDVGCASGIFLREVRRSGNWDVEGVEFSEYAARIAREHHHLNVRTGTLEQAAFPDEYFDTITMWDVLEHLHDPKASLREINRILKRSGVVVIRVPNASGWDARVFGRYWAGFEPPRHLYVFSPKTLDKMLSDCGLSAKKWSSGTAAYTTFLLSVRLWTSEHEKHSSTRDALIRFLYHPAMRLLTTPLFYLLGLGVRGPQMVVTAFKNVSESK